jgi:hypothetical protein
MEAAVTFLTGLGSRVWAYVAAAGLFLAVLARAYSAGRKSAVADQQAKTLENTAKAKEATDEVNALEPDAVRDRLRDRWTR